MNKFFANAFTCVLIGVLSLLAIAQDAKGKHWIGTWATAPQPPEPGQELPQSNLAAYRAH